MKLLYDEVIRFLVGCGGSYRHLHSSTCRAVLEALRDNRCLICRDGGEICRVLVYWLVQPDDIETVKSGAMPGDCSNGPIIYLAEHAGIDGRTGFYRAIKQLRQRVSIVKGICWHQRWNDPEKFRYYSRGHKYEPV